VTWWAWVLLWAALVIGSAGAIFLQGRSLWRKVSALFTELGTAADRLGVLDRELNSLAERAPEVSRDLAVFADPARLRQERAMTRSGQSDGRTPRHRATPRP
jgi:hypothetical protein